jgi:glycosyltransferase involved in cell wall biosynthesis
MIYLALPISSQIGWGVCGRNIAIEMSRLAAVRLFTELTPAGLRDELDFRAMHELLPTAAEGHALEANPNGRLNGPLLVAVAGLDMQPIAPGLCGTRTLGYTFFEDDYLPPDVLHVARTAYDHIVAGSTACEERLRAAGLSDVSTVVQGIDPALFEPSAVERRYLRDRFVVFSGGKLELRKGHDIVVRAFKALQDKHSDVVLMTAWHNAFTGTTDMLKASPIARFSSTSTDPSAIVQEFLSENGIDLRRTVILGPKPNYGMARFYKQTDVGLFPNRCEGGTNLVLMEYMACGKPVIATSGTGHRDIITAENSLPLRGTNKLRLERDGRPIALWEDPDLDEVVAALEFAYLHPARLEPIAKKAGEDLKRFTWQHTARQFLRLLAPDGSR